VCGGDDASGMSSYFKKNKKPHGANQIKKKCYLDEKVKYNDATCKRRYDKWISLAKNDKVIQLNGCNNCSHRKVRNFF